MNKICRLFLQNQYTFIGQVRDKSRSGIARLGVKPDRSASGDNFFNAFDLHTTKLICEHRADLLHLMDEPILLDALADQVEEQKVVLVSAERATLSLGEEA